MKILSIFGALIFAFIWASAASGAIYSWTDEDGVMHFANVAPPPQALVVVKDTPGDRDRGDDPERKTTVDDRLKSAENRADDLEQDLDQAKEEAREALQRARALEERLAEAGRLAAEAQRIQEVSYGYEETWEEDYSRSYYGGYGYRAVPFRRRGICGPDRRRHPRISHYRKARNGKYQYGNKPRGGSRDYGTGVNSAKRQSGRIFNQSRSNPYDNKPRKSLKSRHYGVGVNSAKRQSGRIFNQSRSNPLRSNSVSRRAIYY